MKKIVLIFLSVFIVLNNAKAEVAHDGICGEGCRYTLEGGVLTISGSGDVAKINDDAFRSGHNFFNEGSITEVVIKEGIKDIGIRAFSGLTTLEKVTTPSSVSTIEYGAFEKCSELTTLNLSEGLSKIDGRVFHGNTNLSDVKLPNSLTKIGANSFDGTNLSSINIPEKVVDIGQGAFANTKISTVEIPESVTFIGVPAFDTEYMQSAYCNPNQFVSHICSNDSNARLGNASIGTYSKNSDGSTTYFDENGKIKGFKGKRIYTIEEAMAVTGEKNKFKIKYK